MTMEDTRIVYGMRCSWWDGIEKVAKTPGKISIPCCPHCGGTLFEMASPEEWFAQVDTHTRNGHPGYRAFVEWLKGKCFPSYAAAQAVYEAKPGRKVD